MCWDVDPDTLQGECLAFCGGSESSPTCDEPGTTCVIANEGTLILCLPTCDPLEPTCDEGAATSSSPTIRICDVTAPACPPPLQCAASEDGSNAGLCVE